MVAELVTIFCGSLAQSKYLDKSQQRFVFLIIKKKNKQLKSLLNTLDELAMAFAVYWFPINNHFLSSKLNGFFFIKTCYFLSKSTNLQLIPSAQIAFIDATKDGRNAWFLVILCFFFFSPRCLCTTDGNIPNYNTLQCYL